MSKTTLQPLHRLFDISPTLSPRVAVWPGDTPLSRMVLSDMRTGDRHTLSALTATAHLGAHADAPSHYGRDAPAIDRVALEPYLGACEVRGVSVDRGRGITPAMVGPVQAERLLLRTGTFPDPDSFNEDFAALSAELVDDLWRQGVRLVGVDTPSIDLFDSKDLPAHRACLGHEMAVLEGLVLNHVPDGRYELIALPLKLVGFDASPVRAVLRPL